jgi:hypothetical protein
MIMGEIPYTPEIVTRESEQDKYRETFTAVKKIRIPVLNGPIRVHIIYEDNDGARESAEVNVVAYAEDKVGWPIVTVEHDQHVYRAQEWKQDLPDGSRRIIAFTPIASVEQLSHEEKEA